MNESTGLSASDVALLSDKNGSGWGGETGFIWIFALLILCMGGFGGGGFGGGYQPQFATQADVQNGFNHNDLQTQNLALFESGNRNTSDIIGAVKESQIELATQNGLIQTSATAIARDNAECCCETQKMLLNSDMMNMQNTADINARITASEMNTNAQIQKVLDQMQANRIEELQNKVNALERQNSLCGIVKYPTSMSYCAGQSPFCGGGCCGTM